MAWVGPRARAHSRATLHPRRPAPGPCAWKAKKRKKPCGREWGGRASALSRAAACMNLHVHVRVHVHVRPLITGQLYMYDPMHLTPVCSVRAVVYGSTILVLSINICA